MKSSGGVGLKTAFAILVMVIFGPLGNVLLKKGMAHAGSAAAWTPNDILPIFERTFTSGIIWMGVASLITFFIANMLVLTWADYSFVQPVASVAYGVVALLGYLLLGEAITPIRWLGVVVICFGVLLVGNTPPKTTNPETGGDETQRA